MPAAMKAFNTNLHLPAQPLFDIFEKGTAFVDLTDRNKPAETRQVGQRESDSQLVLVCYRVRGTSTFEMQFCLHNRKSQ